MRPCSSMIAGQPCLGSTSILSNSAAPGVRGDGAADARGARGAEPAAAGVLGDVGRRDAIAAGEPLARDVARAVAHVAAVVPEERAAAGAVVGVVIAVAVLDDPVGLVDTVGVVVAAARAEGEREDGDGDERDVAGAM